MQIEKVEERTTADLCSYARMRECLSLQLMPAEGNEELLEKVPHIRYKDLALVFRFVFPGSPGEEASVLLTLDLLRVYGVTPRQLTEDAFLICPANRPLTVRNMEEVLFGPTGDGVTWADEGRCSMEPHNNAPDAPDGSLWVISSAAGRYGAAAVFYPGALEDIARKLGCGYYLIPSSVHEMLAVPDPMCMGAEPLDQMVENVNATEVAEEDRLTDHCYHYDPVKKLFETGTEHEARIR